MNMQKICDLSNERMKIIIVLVFFAIFNFITCNNVGIIKNKSNCSNNKKFIPYLGFAKSSNKKNLIIGAIHNYSLDVVLPFFQSLIYSDFKNYDIVIFVRKVSEILKACLKNFGVFIYEIPEKYNNIPVINLRWKMYIDFLNQNKDKYNLIFSSDIRDTFFQKAIFKFYEKQGSFLGVAIEDGTLNNDKNKKWIIDFVGNQKYQMIKNERIICIGTIWGSVDKFLDFSNIFWKNLISNPNSIEQGICNYLFYYEKIFKDCLVKSDNYGPVMTIGLTKRDILKLDSNNNLLNFKGEVAAVVHQYDRKPDIVNITINKYNLFTKRDINETRNYYKNIIVFLIFLQIIVIILFLKSFIFFYKS